MLDFPKYTDGRAYSQARLLRERLGYRGELRATGNVLRDQLLFMRRCRLRHLDGRRHPRLPTGNQRFRDDAPALRRREAGYFLALTSGPVGTPSAKFDHFAVAATTLFFSVPIFSISSSTVSPATICLSPAKVPSEMTSPASIGV
jgi:hypothetical protein